MVTQLGNQSIEVIAYHHLPVFHTEHCVFCRFLSTGTSYKDCGRPCESHQVALRDRNGREHPVIADVGSGTGISAELFLRAGYAVHAVEPNREMRAAAERLLARFPNFHSVDGSAQATTLPDHGVDFIVAAQAFHWFNTPETRAEFTRILKPGGQTALIWNERRLDATPFLSEYEQLLLTFG
ncbi:MAG: class I SAM-dependent methyltransferase, partial [Oxalobacteraceae bacterium]|nr:class I SAM-dependent methyltransferase [Oxalobacteraceae bacterium]